MPELPEVEACCELVSRYCLNSTITNVNVIEQGRGPRHGLIDEIVLCESEGEFEKAMVGKSLLSIERKGKYLWMSVKNAFILFHCGMTGSFVVKDKEKSTYKSFKVNDEDVTTGERIFPPRFTKIEIIFANGNHVAFCDPRRLGRVRILSGDPRLSPPICDLAPDPIIDGIDLAAFTVGIRKATCPIKSILLDQQKVICGIGNWVADEVLYQAGIHPATPCNKLNNAGIQRLATCITHVLSSAIECNSRRESFPIHWLFHYRWGKKNQGSPKSPKTKLPNGREISFVTVGGRTSAYVAALQPRYGAYNMFENDLAAAEVHNTEPQGDSTQKKRKQSSGKKEEEGQKRERGQQQQKKTNKLTHK